MADIELGNFCEDEQYEDAREQQEEEEDTSFTENTDNAEYDNIPSQISSDRVKGRESTRIDLDDIDFTDLKRQIQDHLNKKATQRYDAIQALETATDTRFSVTHGDSFKELIDNISDAKYSEKGNLIALKYKGEDVKLTAKGKINQSDTVQNKNFLEAIGKAKVEYEKSIASVVNETLDISLSDEAIASVQESISVSLEDLVWDKYNEISQSDPDKNIEREINGIPHVD